MNITEQKLLLHKHFTPMLFNLKKVGGTNFTQVKTNKKTRFKTFVIHRLHLKHECSFD